MTPSSVIDPARVAHLFAAIGHNRALGVRYLEGGGDWCRLALDWRDDLVGDPDAGVLASGPILSLMDMATSLAVVFREKRLRPQATLDLRIDYLRAARPRTTVIGRGECYRVTSRIAFVRGSAHDGDPADPVAHVAGSFMFTDAA